VQRVDVVEADTSRVGEFFKPESADLIVTELSFPRSDSRSRCGSA
jgi:hypothetical protein